MFWWDNKRFLLGVVLLCCLCWGCGGKDGVSGEDPLVRPGVTPTILGAVRDEQGQGLAGAIVQARNPGGGSLIHSDTTNTSGGFRLVLQGFTLGRQLELRASMPGFRDTSQTIRIESSETVGLFMVLLREGVTFIGRATDVLAGGVSLSGVDVTLRDADGNAVQTAVTDGQGDYTTLVNATRGEIFVLNAQRVGFAPRTDTVEVQGDTVVVDFPLSLAIVGAVKDLRGEPIANAVVTTVGGSTEGSVAVDRDGRYVLTLKQHTDGDTVLVSATGYFDARQWVPFSRRAENRADFQLAPVLDPLPQASPQSVVFSLLAEQDTLMISNAEEAGDMAWSILERPAWLSLEPNEGVVEVGQEANQVVIILLRDQIPTGGQAEVSGSILIGFNSISSPSLEISVTAVRRSVGGNITNVNGQPLGGVSVSLGNGIGDDSPASSGVSDSKGRFALGMITDGNYVLVAQADGHLSSSVPVVISGGRPIAKDLSLIPFPSPAEMVYESDVPFSILIDPEGDGDRAYVLVRTNPPDNLIKVVSGLSSGQGSTSRAGSDIRVGANPTDGGFWENHLVVACFEDTSLWMVNLSTDATDRILTSQGPFGLAISGNKAYVACEGDGGTGVLDVVDLEAQKVEKKVELGRLVALPGDEPWGPGVSVSGTQVFVTDNQESGRIFVVDFSGSEPKVSSLNAGGRPQAIRQLKDGLHSYVLNKRDPSGVTVIDRVTGAKGETITISDGLGDPRALALPPDPLLGRRLLYIFYEQELVFYDLDLETEVGRFEFTDDATARAVSAAVTPDGMGMLIGLERAPLGRRLLFLRFGN